MFLNIKIKIKINLKSKFSKKMRILCAIMFSTCNSKKTRRSIRVHWVACGTCYSKTEGTELGGIELQRSSHFFQVGGH